MSGADEHLNASHMSTISPENWPVLPYFSAFTWVWMPGDAKVPWFQLFNLTMFSTFQFGWKCVPRLNTIFMPKKGQSRYFK